MRWRSLYSQTVSFQAEYQIRSSSRIVGLQQLLKPQLCDQTGRSSRVVRLCKIVGLAGRIGCNVKDRLQ